MNLAGYILFIFNSFLTHKYIFVAVIEKISTAGTHSKKPSDIAGLRAKLHEIVFESETVKGRLYDIVLLIMILMSILILMLETVPDLKEVYRGLFYRLEWLFTVYFTLEYALRIYSAKKPGHYMYSFYGSVDLLSILPSYLELFFPGAHSLMIIRSLRLIRVFRIFKLDAFVAQGNTIVNAIIESKKKLTVFALMIIILSIIFGSVMYLAENEVNPKFDSIPRGVYWTIVTITTVGYGDISPVTSFGQFVASCIMLMGYIIIAVPTGIVTSAVMRHKQKNQQETTCPSCQLSGHESDARFCRGCGEKLQ